MGTPADRPDPDIVPPPDVLQRFLFNLARDYLPVGYIEHALAMAKSPAQTSEYMGAYPELHEMVQRWERTLHRTPVGG